MLATYLLILYLPQGSRYDDMQLRLHNPRARYGVATEIGRFRRLRAYKKKQNIEKKTEKRIR